MKNLILKSFLFLSLSVFGISVLPNSTYAQSAVDYLIVGAGGGSGCASTPNGGGDAGQVISQSAVATFDVGIYPVVVGTKGAQNCSVNPYDGTAGGSSSFNSETASGGSGGLYNNGDGGTGAGASNSGCNGGDGLNLSISTTTRYYAGGGACYNGASPTSGQGYNWYGGGASGSDGIPAKDGVVIIRYPTADMTATGGSTYTDGSDTIHVFETSGDFEITACSVCVAPTPTPSTATTTIIINPVEAVYYPAFFFLFTFAIIIFYFKRK